MDAAGGIGYSPGLAGRAMVARPGIDRSGAGMVKLTVRERESIQEAVRRFRKLVERSGIKKEMRRREFFEKPSETKRRARLRAERRTKRNRLLGV
jgi:small subunit ribosomal protein S21